jgi:Alpha galactosidase A
MFFFVILCRKVLNVFNLRRTLRPLLKLEISGVYGANVNDSVAGVLSITDFTATYQDRLIPLAGPSHWNDSDMVVNEIGNVLAILASGH